MVSVKFWQACGLLGFDQQTLLHYMVVYVKFSFITATKIGGQVLRNSEKAFNDVEGHAISSPLPPKSKLGIPLGEVSRESCSASV